MRILCLADGFLPQVGGAEVAIHNLAEGLVLQGHQVLVCTPFRKGLTTHKRIYELQRFWVPRGFHNLGWIDWWIGNSLVKVVKEWQPDIINAHTCWPSGYSAVVNRHRINKPIITTSHGGDIQQVPSINYGRRLRPRIDRKIRKAVMDSDGLIAISKTISEEYLRIGALSSNITIIPNSINYNELIKKNNNVRSILGLRPSDFIIIAVGRNHPKKGFEDLIKSMVFIRDKYPNAVTLIVGKKVQELSSLVNSYNLEGIVRLFDEALPIGIEFINMVTSPLKQIQTFFQAADIYAMPSIVEGLPIVALEALASGLPIVASSTPGALDLVDNGINGLLYPLGDADALADSISWMIENVNERNKMSINSQKKAAIFDRSEIALKYLLVFQKLME